MFFKKKEIILLNTFVYSNFNYCPLVSHFAQQSELLEYFKTTSDHEFILSKSGKSRKEVKQLRALALEVFKTLSNMNPE